MQDGATARKKRDVPAKSVAKPVAKSSSGGSFSGEISLEIEEMFATLENPTDSLEAECRPSDATNIGDQAVIDTLPPGKITSLSFSRK